MPGTGGMPRRFAVAAWEQLEALHSEWSARTQGHVGESAPKPGPTGSTWAQERSDKDMLRRDPLAQRGRKSGLTKTCSAGTHWLNVGVRAV